jgi:mono/diheme cytochrome c family protein
MNRILVLLVLLACPLRAEDAPRLKLDYTLFAEGKDVYERNCILCHGPRGDGNGELSKGLLPKPRSFREGLFKFRSTPWDKLPTEEDLRHTITGGLSGTAMGAFAQLREDEVTSVIEYIKSFSRRWRKTEHYAEALTVPAPPEWLQKSEAAKPHIDKGKLLFSAACASCHGAKADGQGPAANALRDVWGLASKPADLRQHLRCGDRPEDLYKVLLTGLNGTPMISFASTLSDEQRWQIIAYVRTLQP